MYYELEKTFNGLCYKNWYAFKNKSGICYIPEYNTLGQNYDTEIYIRKERAKEYSCYTYDDIRDEVIDELEFNYSEYNYGDEEIDNITETVFEMIDWQHPSSLLSEIDWSEDLQNDEV